MNVAAIARSVAGALAVLTSSACGYSVDEVQSMPVASEVKVPGSWDAVGTCVATAYTGEYHTSYLPVPSQQRATIIVKMIGPGIVPYATIMYIFEVAGTADGTTVTLRHRPVGGADAMKAKMKELIERCGARS